MYMYMHSTNTCTYIRERERERERGTLSRCDQSVVNRLICHCLHNEMDTVGLVTVTTVAINMTVVLMAASLQQEGNLKRRDKSRKCYRDTCT